MPADFIFITSIKDVQAFFHHRRSKSWCGDKLQDIRAFNKLRKNSPIPIPMFAKYFNLDESWVIDRFRTVCQ